MSPRDRVGRNDELSRLLMDSYAGLRAAEPPPTVWRRIARRIEPRRSGHGLPLLGRALMLTTPDGASITRLLTWAALPSTAALSLLVLVGLALGGPGARGGGVSATQLGHSADLTAAELAYQPPSEGEWIGVAPKRLLRSQRSDAAADVMANVGSSGRAVGPPGIALR